MDYVQMLLPILKLSRNYFYTSYHTSTSITIEAYEQYGTELTTAFETP